jgi:hypothetical protein
MCYERRRGAKRSLGPLGGSGQLDFDSNGQQARASEVLLSFLSQFFLFLFFSTFLCYHKRDQGRRRIICCHPGLMEDILGREKVLPSLLVLLSCRLMRGVLRRQADIVDIGPGYIPRQPLQRLSACQAGGHLSRYCS